jgi:hypothetical protein
MSKKDERQKIKATVKSTVASVLAEDETTQKVKMEEVFAEYETTLAELRDAEVAASEKNAELAAQVDSLVAEKEALESEITSLKDELAIAKRAVEDATKKSDELAKKINDMEKEAAMLRRVKELEEAGLLSSGKSADRLKARIKGMDDEEYAEYKSELVSLREDWLKEVPTPEKVVAEVPAAVPVVDATATVGTTPEVVKVEPVTAATAETTPTPTADAGETASTESSVSDSESAKMTAAKLLQLKKDLASLNLKTTIGSLEDDEALVQEYASIMWPEKEESK